MLVTSKITIDLTRKEFKQYLYATQDDSNTRAVEITLLASGEAWNVPEGTVGAVSCKKPDKTSCFYDTLPDGVTKAVIFEGNKVIATFAPQVLSAAGDVDASVALFDTSLNRLGTFPFIIRVEKNPSAGQDISNDYYSFKTLEVISNSIGDLTGLKTSAKSNLVDAINELSGSKYPSLLYSEIAIVDRVTGLSYVLFFEDGKLCMDVSEVTGTAVDSIVLIDQTSGAKYALYVSAGKLVYEESE